MRGDSALAIGDPGNVDSLFLDVSSLSITNYLISNNRYYFAFYSGSLSGSFYIYGKNLPDIGYLSSLTSLNNIKGDVTGFDFYIYSNGNSQGGYKVSSLDISLKNLLNFAPYELEEEILKNNDDIQGSSNADIIFSQSGSDQITGSGGDDKIDGGAGNDKAIFSGNLGSYEISVDNVTYTVKDLRKNSPDGTDKIEYIEYLVFNDQTITPSEAVKIDRKRYTNNGLTNGENYRLENIRDFNGNLHGGGDYSNSLYSYKYQGKFDVNNDGLYEHVFTNKESGRWVTGSTNSYTGELDYSDFSNGGITRVVGIYIDPLVTSGEVEQFGPHDSQRRFQNDLLIDNLTVKTSGDYDSDGFQEVYWKTNDGTAYLRALMHADGNIQYANYQSEEQMSDYLTSKGYESVISDIV